MITVQLTFIESIKRYTYMTITYIINSNFASSFVIHAFPLELVQRVVYIVDGFLPGGAYVLVTYASGDMRQLKQSSGEGVLWVSFAS